MKIKLWADLVDWPLVATVSGDVITINGESIDLSGIHDGYRLPGSAVGNKFFVETEYVERIGKTLHFTLRLPVHWDSPEEYRSPSEPIIIDVHSGPVKFPVTTPLASPPALLPEVQENQNG
ncbi:MULTISPECIES: hypothetical protein [unclassified Pseudomonas]|uniref:hypothetical protein n=1 Tax=unclassified Pseudomonas TaxID=196821 RepID=UPI001622E3EE|nr:MULTISPECIES: hypothetical protein [unclassified Pseudomonas]MBB6287615.1 hypothetical protein [Pseudomonas sp. SJZ073]MBB6310457.1 hypothetical protein [Pseudomonas sp. JAI120]